MPRLDHIIILVSSLSDVKAYKHAGFQVIPGGKHADGLTENALVVLPDGVYLELIAFCDSTTMEQRTEHWWGSKPLGLVDWSIAEAGGKTLAEEVGGNPAYAAPQKGGRQNPHGQKIGWEVVFPIKGGRGRLPFYCSDTTPREWRVPTLKSPHENGVLGVHQLTLITKSTELLEYAADLSLVLGPSNSPGDEQLQEFPIKSPHGGTITITLRTPNNDEEREWLVRNVEGLHSIKLRAASLGDVPTLTPEFSSGSNVTLLFEHPT